MKNSALQQSPSTPRESYGPATALEHIPTVLLEAQQLATETQADPRLVAMLESLSNLLFDRPAAFVAAVTGGAHERR